MQRAGAAIPVGTLYQGGTDYSEISGPGLWPITLIRQTQYPLGNNVELDF